MINFKLLTSALVLSSLLSVSYAYAMDDVLENEKKCPPPCKPVTVTSSFSEEAAKEINGRNYHYDYKIGNGMEVRVQHVRSYYFSPSAMLQDDQE